MSKTKISKLKVLKSNAGYYIGREYHNEDDYIEPYSRVSSYYKDRNTAQHHLDRGTYIEVYH